MDWKTVLEKIAQDDQNKWGRKVSSHELRMADSGALRLGNGGPDGASYALSDLAVAQMSQKLEMERFAGTLLEANLN